MKKAYTFILLLILISPFKISALKEGCTTEEINRLKELVEKVEISPNFITGQTYSITLNNLDSNIYAIDDFDLKYDINKTTINPRDYGNMIYMGLGNYNFKFYASSGICSDELIGEKSIKLKWHNNISDSEICKNNKDSKYCVPFSDTQIDYNTAYQELTKTEDTTKVSNNTIIIITVVSVVSLIAIIFIGKYVIDKKFKDR